MGAWGTALFSDDTTCSVRDAYRERLADGMDGIAATADLIAQWKVEALDPIDDDALLFWLALAATQWKVGRLEDGVRSKAITIIDSGEDLKRWEEAGTKAVTQRRAVLQKLRDQLLSSQPAPKKVRVERPQVPPWSCGDFVSYRLRSGALVILYVEDVLPNSVYCSFLDWVGDSLPDADTILGLPKRGRPPYSHDQISLYTMRKRGIPFDRLNVLTVKHLAPKTRSGAVLWDWKDLDYHLEDCWQLK